MRIIKDFGTRELILRGVELTWIFLFNYCYCKIADLVRLKGRFETKKQKDVKRDGIFKVKPFRLGRYVDISVFLRISESRGAWGS